MEKKNFCESNKMVFSNYDYAEFSKLAVDCGLNTLSGVTKEEANAKIREIYSAVLGLDEKATRRDIRRALRRKANEVFEVTEDILEELVIGGWGDNPFFNEYVEYRNANFGDTNVWTVPDDTILTVSELSGGHHDIIRQRLGIGETFGVKTQWYGVKVYAEFERFLAGLVDWAHLIQKVYEALDNKINALVYAAFESAGSQLPGGSQFVKTGTLVKATLVTLIEDVQAANPGKEIVLMGTKSALSQLDALADTDWISDSMKEDRHTLGRQGIWEGTRLVELAQRFAPNDTTTKLVNAKKILVMPIDPSNKMVKVYDEGEGMIKEVTDGNTNMDMTMEYEYQMKMGAAVVFSKYFGQWTLN